MMRWKECKERQPTLLMRMVIDNMIRYGIDKNWWRDEQIFMQYIQRPRWDEYKDDHLEALPRNMELSSLEPGGPRSLAID